MKKMITLLLLCALLARAGCGAQKAADPSAPEETAAEQTADAAEAAPGEDEPQAPETGAFGDLLFDTADLDGNPVHAADLFAQHRITMVNVWMTWCGPCVSEMPELAALSEEFAAQDVGLIGVCMDAVDAETVSEAKEILSSAGAEFPVLAGFDGGDALFQLYAVPTSFFVDSEGHVLGEPVIGADPQQYRETVARLLKEMDGQ
jgi:thiol-disulfide isomerase/thioredoxin